VPEWRAEVVVDAGLARRLIGGQFPKLKLESLRLLAEGWDNAAWLVDETYGRGSLAGVIDWGDLCIADPAADLHVLWSVLPPEGHGALIDAYGPVSEAQLVCARVLAVFLSAVLAVYGRVEGLTGVEREAVAGLVRAASD
jgi:Phosphotransferase enzyme family